jgi:hypothetical protein
MSKTRQRFEAKKKAKRKQRADDAYLAAHTLACSGKRRRFGREGQICGWPVVFGKVFDTAFCKCRRCGQQYRCYGSKWFKIEDYEIGVHDMRKEEERDKQGEYEGTWDRPRHESNCRDPDFDTIGLKKVQRKMTGGPGVIRLGWAMVDREGRIRHYCVPEKGA